MARDRMCVWARHYAPGDEQAFEPAQPPLHEWDWSSGTPGPTWTLVRRDGGRNRVLGLAGLNFFEDYKAHLWSVLSELSLREWRLALQEAAKVMHRIGPIYRHLPITADAGDPPARRCLEKLGFVDTGFRREHPGLIFHVYRRML